MTNSVALTGYYLPRLLVAFAASLFASLPARGGTLSIVHSFTGGADGATPYKGPTTDTKGNSYGETFYGAGACPDSYTYANVGCGTVYKIDTTGTMTTLVTFKGQNNGADGDGNLTIKGSTIYGTAYTGGADNQGILFSLNTNGHGFKILHSFTGADGEHPNTFPRIDANGNIFSETPFGGPGYSGSDKTGSGMLYEITAAGDYIAQHDFSGGADGADPGRIFLDASGNIFGATVSGGSCTGTGLPSAGCGVIFEFVPSTGTFTVLYTFAGKGDGYAPQIGAMNSAGDLFGVTDGGGSAGYGTLFELRKTSAGYKHTTLWAFTGGADGADPVSPPTLTSKGALVGTTTYGPINGSDSGEGVLYSYSKGTLTTLYTFTNDANGGYPESTPLVTKSGTIFGAAAFGGTSPCDTSTGTLISSYGCGVLYSYTP